jgi:malonic semialdehyde reductase
LTPIDSNDSQFYERFKFLVEKLKFRPIQLNQDLNDAAILIQKDRKHLDNNPKNISNDEIIKLLSTISS